jgi:hypothetical protein
LIPTAIESDYAAHFVDPGNHAKFHVNPFRAALFCFLIGLSSGTHG